MASTTYINNVEITNGANTTSYLIEPTLFKVATTEDSGATYTTSNLTGFTLLDGVAVQIKFGITNKNDATISVGGTTAKPIYYNNAAITANTLKANHIYTLVYNGSYWQVAGDIDTNTTYTIATGTANGKIKVTPSSGTAYEVSVYGLGDRAFDSTTYLSLAGGVMSGSIGLKSGNAAITNVNNQRIYWETTDTTPVLKGYITTATDGNMGIHSTGALYFRPGNTNGAIDTTTGTIMNNGAFYPYATDTMSLGTSSRKWTTVYATTFSGNATSATEFSSGTTVKLTGDVTGESSSSKKGWSLSTTIGSGKVTNAMLAGSITNAKLSNSKITINSKVINLGDSVSLADIGAASTTTVNGLLAAADAMIFKGTLGTSGTITAVPDGTSGKEYQAGYTYKIITAGTYAGIVCEEGDLLIAISDSTSEQTAVNDAHWVVVQTNIDGAVTGPASVTADSNIAIFDNTTGKIIKDSGTTIANASVAYATNAGGVAQTGITTNASYPILFKNNADITDENASINFSSNVTGTATTTKPFTYNPNTGTLIVSEIKIAIKSDSYGLFPNTNNYNIIGNTGLYWYKAYITNYYGTTSNINNWASGKNIGIPANSSAASTLGTVNFVHNCAKNGTQTTTLLTADSGANTNNTVTLPIATGTLALTSDNITGNAATATEFENGTTVKLTGDVTGESSSSKIGWTVATTLADSGVTADSYGPSAAVSGTDGTTVNIPYITVDSKGRVTALVNTVYTAVNTWRPIGTGATDAMAGNTNINNVFQDAVTYTDYTNWRPLVWGNSNSGTEGFTPSDSTAGVFTTSSLTCQPSTGTIRLMNLKLVGSANSAITYTDGTTSKQMIQFIKGNANGHAIKIGGGALTVIGGGESATNISPTVTNEQLYLLADNVINIEANADTIANRLGIQITTGGHILPIKAESKNTNKQNLGASDAIWATIYATTLDSSILKLHQGTAVDPSTSSNARIEFDYTSGQPVYICYTPNNSYRKPAGLKIMGNGDTTDSTGSSPAWLEVEGQIYAAGFNGPLTGNVTGSLTGNADTATNATNDSDGNAINTTYVKKVTSTDDAVVRFNGTSGDIQNSGAILTDGGTLCINPTTAASFNEGIRINQANNGWAEVVIGGSSGSTSGNASTAWLVGRRGTNCGSGKFGAAGDFTIEDNDSTGTGWTLHQGNGGMSLYTNKAKDTASLTIKNVNALEAGKTHWIINALTSAMVATSKNVILLGRANSTKNSGYLGFYYAASGDNTNYLTLGFYGADDLVKLFPTGQLSITKDIDSTSTTDGSLITAGGVGIAKTLYVGTGANITGQTVIDRQTAHSTSMGSSQLVVRNSKDASGNYVAIEMQRGSTYTNTTYTSWQFAIEDSGNFHIRNNYKIDNSNLSSEGKYEKDTFYIVRNTGEVHMEGKASSNIVEIRSTAAEAHIGFTRTSYNYVTTPSGSEIRFQGGTTCDMKYGALIIKPVIDGTNGIGDTTVIYPGVSGKASLGTSDKKWKDIYASGTYYGKIQQEESTGNYARPIWFCYYDNGVILGKPGYNNNFTYNPSTRNINFTDNATITVSTDKTLGVNTTTGTLTVSSTTGALTIQSSTGAIKIQNTSTGGITLSSGNTLFINKPTNAPIIFTSGGADADHEKGRFNINGMFQLATSVTQDTHKLLVNGNSAFNGRLGFITAAANTLAETAAIEYNTTGTCINFRIGPEADVAKTMKLDATAFYHATTNTGTLGTTTYKWKAVYIEAQSNANTEGLMFYTSTNLRGRIGVNTSGGLGIYGIDNLYFRTSLTDTTKGMQLSTTNLYPSTNDGIDLGSTTNEWKYTYSKKFIVEQHVTMEWNATDQSLDFIFA